MFVKSRNATIGSSTIVADNDLIGITSWVADDGTDFVQAVAQMYVEIDDASPAANQIGAAYVFQNKNAAGTSQETFRINSDGVVILPKGQINFPATQNASSDANTLDDYEEGTFTPAIADGDNNGSGEGQAYTVQVGRYTKIGNRVFFNLQVLISDLGTLTAGDGVRLVGLPFAASATTNSEPSVYVGYANSLALPTASESVTGYISINESIIHLQLWDATTGVSLFLISELSVGAHLLVSGQYEV
jgi:hypothetical protein